MKEKIIYLFKTYKDLAITDICKFDEKYKDYVEEGHYGMAIENPLVLALTSIIFETWFTRMKGFMFSQIKLKFGSARVYTNLPSYMNCYLEELINFTIKLNDEEKRELGICL